MSKNIVVEIPENNWSLFAETFQVEVQNPKLSPERKNRIMNLFTDIKIQKEDQHHIIYSKVDKQTLAKWLTDLTIHYRNSGKVGIASNVEHLIKEL